MREQRVAEAPAPVRAIVEVHAPPEVVYALLADVTRMGEWSPECVRCRWIGAAPGGDGAGGGAGSERARPGARFRGTSRSGRRRWSTVSTVTAADPGRCFAFDVTYLRLPVATWRYDLRCEHGRTVLEESMVDRRGRLLRAVSPVLTGHRDRRRRNDETMHETLRRLKAAAESR